MDEALKHRTRHEQQARGELLQEDGALHLEKRGRGGGEDGWNERCAIIRARPFPEPRAHRKTANTRTPRHADALLLCGTHLAAVGARHQDDDCAGGEGRAELGGSALALGDPADVLVLSRVVARLRWRGWNGSEKERKREEREGRGETRNRDHVHAPFPVSPSFFLSSASRSSPHGQSHDFSHSDIVFHSLLSKKVWHITQGPSALNTHTHTQRQPSSDSPRLS